MDIEFPPWLGFLRDLCPQWPDPPASETGMREIAEILHAAAGQLQDLIPELAGVSTHTAAVLTGDTADAFTQQFAKLLNGQYSVHHDVDAIEALAELADHLGTEIQYFKLMAISTLVIAAAAIAWALFNADWSLGASLAEVPIAELLAENTIRQLAAMVLERIGAALAATLSRTALARMLVEGGVGALIGAGQELAVQGFQDLEGWRNGIDVGQLAKNAVAMGVSGMAAGVVGHDLGELLGEDGTLPIRFLKGAVTGAASGVAANAAGNLVGGNDVGANTFLGAAMGFAGGFAPGHAGAAAPAFDAETADSAVPANAIDTHPTLRFEPQPDGTFAWPGETTNDAGPQAHTAWEPAPTTQPAVPAGELGAGAPAGNGWSAAADPTADDRGGLPSNGSPGAGDPGVRSAEATSHTPPAAADTAHLPATSVTAGLDPPPAVPASLGSHLPEDTLDPSRSSPAPYTGPIAATASPAVSHLPLESNALSPATPTLPTAAGPPSPAPISPPASGSPSRPHPNAGLSSPTPDLQAGPADTSLTGKSSPEPAGVPAAGRFNTTAAHTEPGTHDMPAQQAAHAARVDPAAHVGQPELGSHVAGRQDNAAADRQQRPADLLTQRQDPSTRPNANRHDPSTAPRGRPGELPHRSGVTRNITQDLQPAAATRAPDPLATAQDIGIIKARHDDSGPGPSEPRSHKGGRDGSDGENTPDPATDGGGAGRYRYEGSGRDGSGRGGAGRGGGGPSDGSGAGDPPDCNANDDAEMGDDRSSAALIEAFHRQVLATLTADGAEPPDSVSALLARVTPDRLVAILRNVPADRRPVVLWRFKYGLSAQPMQYLLRAGGAETRWGIYKAARAYVEAVARIFGEEPPRLPGQPVNQPGVAKWFGFDPRAAVLPRDEQECLLGYEQLRPGTTHAGAAALVAEQLTFETLGAYGVPPKWWSIFDVEATMAGARARLAGSLPTVPDELATAAVGVAQRLNPDALRRAYLKLGPLHAYYAWLRFTGGLSHDEIAAELDTAIADPTFLGKWSILTPIPTSTIGPESRFTTTDLSALEKTTTTLIAGFLLDAGPPSHGVETETALVAMTSGWHLQDLPTAVATLPPRLRDYAIDRYLQGMTREHAAQNRGWSVDDTQRLADDVLAELTRPATPMPATGTQEARLDAIVVPARATDSASKLSEAADLAHRLGCPIVALYTGGVPEDIGQMGRRYPNLVALQLPDDYRHELLQFRTADAQPRPPAGRRQPAHFDISCKRNVGLLLGRLSGWRRVLFLDDDIRGLRPEQVGAAAAALDRYGVVGVKPVDFPDNSVICHAYRLAGGSQDTFLSGSALLVDPSSETSFFPPVYNEDWLFFNPHVAAGRVAVAGTASQLPYDPFAHPDRAFHEEFGDILAEGIFDLLHRNMTPDLANETFWSNVLSDRRSLIDATMDRLSTLPGHAARAALKALATARRHEFSPTDFTELMRAWQADRTTWAQRLGALPHLGSITEAAELLGLRLSRWDEPDNSEATT